MCGIVGVIGKVGGKEEKLFKQLLIVDSLRGDDSTGVASVSSGKDVIVAKGVGDPYQLFENWHFDQIMRRKNVVLIGHNRAATTGKVNRKNAHPFEFDKLVGVHNGTLRNKHILDDSHKFDTDSEALYYNINNKGLSDALEKVNGAYSLVWYDKEEHTINFIRNNERPMNLLMSKDMKTLFFASESWMLTALLSRDNYEFGSIEKLPEDQHFSYQIPAMDGEFEKAKVRAVKPIPFTQPKVITEVGTSTKAGTGTGTATTGGTKEYPKANEFLKKFKLKKKRGVANTIPLRIGTEIEGEAVSYCRLYGGYYVTFQVDEYPDEDFRCYFPTDAECKELVGGRFRASISRYMHEKGEWIYKLDKNTIKEYKVEDEKAVERKPDNTGKLIDKDEFDLRYHNCQWCCSPVIFEEKWVAYTADQLLCESCASDAEVAQYLPELRKSA